MAWAKLKFTNSSLAMKLFHRSPSPPQRPKEAVESNAATLVEEPQPKPLPEPPLIALSSEQKSMLEEPLDPRVNRILHELYANKATAEQALNAGRIIQFPHVDSRAEDAAPAKNGGAQVVDGL
jgi:hypothetical protein